LTPYNVNAIIDIFETISIIEGLISMGRYDILTNAYTVGDQHSSPFLSYLSKFIPKTLKDLFYWCEYLYYQSAHISSAIKKLSDYPITELSYDSEDANLRNKYKSILEDKLRMRDHLQRFGLDLFIYGNSFVSISPEAIRLLICNKCGESLSIEKAQDIKFEITEENKSIKAFFSYYCPWCKSKVKTSKIKRMIVKDASKISITHWDPKEISIHTNPFTGNSEYRYNPSSELYRYVEDNDPLILKETPLELLCAIKSKKYVYKFGSDQLYHDKMQAPSGLNLGWGFPPMAAAIPMFLYATVLRKANEAIALDHMVPFRIIYPQPTGTSADPIRHISLANLQSELEEGIRRHRQDPLEIMYSPVPIGVEPVNGQGRALLTLGEVENAESNIVTAIGVPPEFFRGGLSSAAAASSINLRMLENQLQVYITGLNKLLEWTIKKTSSIMGAEPPIKVTLTDFKFVDDVQQKQLVLQLSQIMGDVLSKQTQLEPYGIDLNRERKKRGQEILDEDTFQKGIQVQLDKKQSNIATIVQNQQAAGAGTQYNQQAIVAQADELISQLMQLPENVRRSNLAQLSNEDYVLYSVVTTRLRSQEEAQGEQAKAMMEQQGGGV
jgi:hypothetical protein